MAQHRLIVSVVAAFSCSVGADVVFVDDDNCPGPGSGTELDPFCSIQTAIDNAVDADEIVVAPGTYFETINFLGKAITLRSSDGPDVTIIDGTGFFHVVQCANQEGPDTILSGFVITGGNANGFEQSNDIGGGMLNDASSPTVINCEFSYNSARVAGGGMFNGESNPTVTNCTFLGNTAASNATKTFGGGIFNNFFSSPAVTNCTFIGNTADVGGGMYSQVSSSPTVSNCTFSGNTANYGGGMVNSTSSPTVTNCEFIDNNAQVAGGGMFNTNQSNPTVTNCTFSGNSADNGGGMVNTSSSSPTVTNCVLWGDSTDEFSGIGTPAVSYSNVQGGFPGIGNIDADPLFVDPDNGDYRLLAGSPCIDAGDNTAVPVGVLRDLDGNPRFVDSTLVGTMATVDMGAYEFQGPVGRAIGAISWEMECSIAVLIGDIFDVDAVDRAAAASEGHVIARTR